jgi:ferredoxin
MSRCIFCGYCELACPFDAITLGNEFELSEYSRDDLIYTKDMLLAEPIKRVPSRTATSTTRRSLLQGALVIVAPATSSSGSSGRRRVRLPRSGVAVCRSRTRSTRRSR